LNPTRSDACNALQSTLPPAMGATCGRREREADTGNGEEQSFHVLVVATVEGTLVHGRSVAFAGCRRNVGLGRSVLSVVGLVPLQTVAPATAGVLWKNEEGNVVGVRQAHALVVADAQKAPARSGTRPSLSPETRARLSSLNPQRESVGGWRGQFGIAVGQTCASRKNRHRGRVERTQARLAARHRFSCLRSRQLEKVVRDASEKEGGHGHRPCEETRVPERCPYVVFRCRSRQAASGLE